jgi:hypothetical protein
MYKQVMARTAPPQGHPFQSQVPARRHVHESEARHTERDSLQDRGVGPRPGDGERAGDRGPNRVKILFPLVGSY